MCVILKVNCTGVGFRSETKARFQHENLGTRLVHSWTCGVVLHVGDIPVPIAGVHAAEWVWQVSIVPHQSRTAASWQCWDQTGARETGQVCFCTSIAVKLVHLHHTPSGDSMCVSRSCIFFVYVRECPKTRLALLPQWPKPKPYTVNCMKQQYSELPRDQLLFTMTMV